MTVRIEVNQVRSTEDGPIYRVTTSVINTEGIDRNIFVFETDTQDFKHVATPFDMNNYPAGLAAAQSGGDKYYRKEVADVGYGDNVALADAAATYTLSRIKLLADQYGPVVEEFEGSEDHIYTEGA